MSVYYPRCRVALRVLLQDDGSDGKAVHTYDVVPRSVSIERNTLREADTFTVELDYRDLPLDPRILRQVHVVIALDDAGAPTRDVRVDSRRDRAFIGLVDEPALRLDDGAHVVELKGRDYTALFLDATWRDGPIVLARPLGLVVGGILSRVPGAESMPVVWVGSAASAEHVVLADKVGRTSWAPKGGDDDAWSLLCELCALAGVLPVVRDDELHIQSPDEFSTRTSAFLYGENISRVEMKRRLNATEQRQIRVRAFDEQSGETAESVWPHNPIVRQKIGADGKVASDTANELLFQVSGRFSTVDLRRMAKRIYLGQSQEVEGTLETREMRSLADDKLVRLTNGDRIGVRLRLGDPDRVAGFDDAAARRLLTTGANPLPPALVDLLLEGRKRADGLFATFYIKSASHRWSRDDGYSLNVQFLNLVGAE